MKIPNKLYRKLAFGFVFIIGLLGLLPPEFVLSTLLFIAVTYGGVLAIKLATAHDLKIKRETKT
ncbi:hypothetical protein [Methylomonas rivi]|uniref:Uncharacterized protein n=1 Tax=Methylomonas rivi TaxID=2952226 RepID=A0ABT1U1H5_9GAMM|nr:hypothetical protein [Methylomonas sp. WSC-6]MBS4051042.1 hypothetical protein [Methylomonas sp.]MCQ8127660.1 hypothetical protein [Methylomonas sp. WSC-6]